MVEHAIANHLPRIRSGYGEKNSKLSPGRPAPADRLSSCLKRAGSRHRSARRAYGARYRAACRRSFLLGGLRHVEPHTHKTAPTRR